MDRHDFDPNAVDTELLVEEVSALAKRSSRKSAGKRSSRTYPRSSPEYNKC